MEDGCGDDEDSKYHTLYKQASQDGVLAQLHTVSSTHSASAAGLDDERHNVSANKDPGEPSNGDDGVGLGMEGSNQSSKHHVDRRCK